MEGSEVCGGSGVGRAGRERGQGERIDIGEGGAVVSRMYQGPGVEEALGSLWGTLDETPSSGGYGA